MNSKRRSSVGVPEPPKLKFKDEEFKARDTYDENESKRLVKNMLILGSSFTFLFTAFMAMANLQSSINSVDGMGMDALAGLYGAFLISSLLLPSIFLSKLKCKLTLVLATSGYILYEASQFYPTFATLMSTALFLGLCAGQLWAAQGTYLTVISEEYAFLTKKSSEAVLQQFFGIFFLFFHSSQIWGNLISSFVLSQTSSKTNNSLESINITKISYDHCGVNFSHDFDAAKNVSAPEIIHRPEDWKINMLTGIFVGSSVASALVILIFVDSLKRYGENERKVLTEAKWNSLLIATVKHWRKKEQILIIPITVWLGIQEAFIASEFTGAYIACAWGVENIGFAMMCFGVCASISSILVGKFMEYLGRTVIFITAGAINLACLITMIYWKPNPDEKIIFFIITGAWGIADGVWSPQVKAIYGNIFTETREAAFSNVGLWLSVGFIIVYLKENRVPMPVKLYFYIGFLCMSMTSYIVLEILEFFKKRKKLTVSTS